MSFGLGDAGPVIDERARADYRRRLAELRTELEDAERCNDPGRATAARAEIEQLGDELRAATGLGGRARRASSDVERMRIAVTRRIRAAIEQLGKLHPALGEHLERSVRTGFTCGDSPGRASGSLALIEVACSGRSRHYPSIFGRDVPRGPGASLRTGNDSRRVGIVVADHARVERRVRRVSTRFTS